MTSRHAWMLAIALAVAACQRDGGAAPDACTSCAASDATDVDASTGDAATPDCTNRVCGPDGAGGKCGTCAAGTFCSSAGQCRADQLEWSGMIWNVRNGTGGPGPNRWDRRNVFIDDDGHLHLLIEFRDGNWTTSEIWTPQSFGFGRYQWFVESRLDLLDRNIVLGLFTYTIPSVGPDTTNEIDIELARWGNSSNDPLNFNVWPAVTGYAHTGTTFPMALSGTYTTHRFDWRSTAIDFGSYHGFQQANQNPIGTWTYAPTDNTVRIPQQPVPVHLNFWLFQGMAPANGQRAEVVIHQFSHTAF